MAFPQFNAGVKIAALASKFLQSKSSLEAESFYKSIKSISKRSRLKKKVIESTQPDKDTVFSFLLRPEPKSQNFTPPNPEPRLQVRFAKWQQISDNLAKMDSVILKEYRERRAEFKARSKKNMNPF